MTKASDRRNQEIMARFMASAPYDPSRTLPEPKCVIPFPSPFAAGFPVVRAPSMDTRDITEADVADSAAVNGVLRRIQNPNRLTIVIGEFAELSQPDAAAVVDVQSLGGSVVSILGDGSVLCWGAAERFGHRIYRDICIAGGAHDGVILLSAAAQERIRRVHDLHIRTEYESRHAAQRNG